MATMTESLQETTQKIPPSHEYHAEAHVLSGELNRPVEQKIEPHLPVALKDYRGGHLTRFTEDVSIEGLIRFKTGHTRVSGSRSLKHNGWITLSTSIIEGLNVFEVITADRLVAQVSTDHDYKNGHVPHVSFLGTKFSNLQLSGYPLKLKLNFGVCGPKPENDKFYLQNSSLLESAAKQAETALKLKHLSAKARTRYDESLATANALLKDRNGSSLEGVREKTKVRCSLVESIEIEDIPIPGLETIGNLLVIPEFGTVALGEIEVGVEPATPPSEHPAYAARKNGSVDIGITRPSNYFTLKMLTMNLGCVAHGTLEAATGTANGGHKP